MGCKCKENAQTAKRNEQARIEQRRREREYREAQRRVQAVKEKR